MSFNVLVDRSDCEGAPVVFEDKPSFAELIGKIEHEAEFGTLMTNFNLIRAGALHRGCPPIPTASCCYRSRGYKP